MLKQQLFAVALFWTGIIAYSCLIQSKDVPVITIPHIDKVIHGFFHFVFTLVWFLFFYKMDRNANRTKALLLSVGLSIVFGITLEVMQKWYTTSRTADVFDFLANLAGAALATAFILVAGINTKKVKLK